jgi:4a-hydroxytetrahydrobiopterin dehydratase
MTTTDELLRKKCCHLDAGLSEAEVAEHLRALEGWTQEKGCIAKTYSFKNYYETLAFVNGIAFLIHSEDHHPELTVSYNRCTVRLNTHSVNGGKGGISENDFICAAKIDATLRHAFA